MIKFKEGEKVICIDAIGTDRLTKNKIYNILPIRIGDPHNLVWIVNDFGNDDYFRDGRFVSIIKHRCEIIDGILK